MIFTDDDVLVDHDLVEVYATAIAGIDEDVAFLGGIIEPWFEQQPDPDLARAIPTVANGYCGISESDASRVGIGRSSGWVIALGANFAVGRHRLGGERFDETLGLKGSGRIAGEEPDFFRRLLIGA